MCAPAHRSKPAPFEITLLRRFGFGCPSRFEVRAKKQVRRTSDAECDWRSAGYAVTLRYLDLGGAWTSKKFPVPLTDDMDDPAAQKILEDAFSQACDFVNLKLGLL